MFRTKLFVPVTIPMAIIAAISLPTAAFAQDAEGSANPVIVIEPTDTAADAASTEQPLVADVIDAPAPVIAADPNVIADSDLLQMRGGQAIVVGNQTLTAISNGNAFTGNYTAGSIALADNTLSNFNGLGNLVINTGAQNNLQSAMNVTINFAQ